MFYLPWGALGKEIISFGGSCVIRLRLGGMFRSSPLKLPACTQLIAGDTDLSWNAGLNQLAELGNRGWLDTNKNGVQDNSEAGNKVSQSRCLMPIAMRHAYRSSPTPMATIFWECKYP